MIIFWQDNIHEREREDVNWRGRRRNSWQGSPLQFIQQELHSGTMSNFSPPKSIRDKGLKGFPSETKTP